MKIYKKVQEMLEKKGYFHYTNRDKFPVLEILFDTFNGRPDGNSQYQTKTLFPIHEQTQIHKSSCWPDENPQGKVKIALHINEVVKTPH